MLKIPSIIFTQHQCVKKYRIPVGDGVRVDDGFREGMEIPMYYDPMIAKLATHGTTRKAAIEKMKWAIQHYDIDGIETTLDFGSFVMHHDAFVSGKFDTSFVGRYFSKDTYLAQVKRRGQQRLYCQILTNSGLSGFLAAKLLWVITPSTFHISRISDTGICFGSKGDCRI